MLCLRVSIQVFRAEAFAYDVNTIEEKWRLIPSDTHILMTHGIALQRDTFFGVLFWSSIL